MLKNGTEFFRTRVVSSDLLRAKQANLKPVFRRLCLSFETQLVDICDIATVHSSINTGIVIIARHSRSEILGLTQDLPTYEVSALIFFLWPTRLVNYFQNIQNICKISYLVSTDGGASSKSDHCTYRCFEISARARNYKFRRMWS